MHSKPHSCPHWFHFEMVVGLGFAVRKIDCHYSEVGSGVPRQTIVWLGLGFVRELFGHRWGVFDSAPTKGYHFAGRNPLGLAALPELSHSRLLGQTSGLLL